MMEKEDDPFQFSGALAVELSKCMLKCNLKKAQQFGFIIFISPTKQMTRICEGECR